MKKKFNVEGMTCSSCAIHVHDAVSKISGVNQCDVNLLLNQMDIDCCQDLKDELIISAVENVGYKASIYQEVKNKKTNKDLIVLIISIILMILVSYISMYEMFSLPIIPILSKSNHYNVNIITQIILTLTIYFIYRKRIYRGTKQLIKNMPTMDSLIALSCISCFIYSLIVYINILLNQNHNINHLFFEAGSMVLVFSSIGKFLEGKAKDKTTDSLSSLLKIAPGVAFLYNNQKEKRIKPQEIKIGDILLVKPGGKIPVDGIVIQGMSYCDQSSITGEAIPIEKNINDNVISSTINLNSPLIIKATSTYQDSTFSKIIELVNQAANSKAPISRFADKISKYFVYGVITISLITFVIWLFCSKDLTKAFNYSMSVLTVSCPCALGLATPTAIMVATGKGASLGIIYKNAAILEETSKIKAILFDKTNTISKGVFKVDKETKIENEDSYYDIIYSLQIKSNHPLANSLVDFCKQHNAKGLNLDVKQITSSGVIAKYKNHIFGIGNNRLLAQYNVKQIDIEEGPYTVLYFFKDNKAISVFYLTDQLKDGSKEMVSRLNNYNLSILTGDNKQQAQYIGKQIGIDDIHYELLPKDKADLVRKYQEKYHKVAMIGDGINDTLALNYSDVSIAVNNSSDVAIESSDIVLMNNECSSIVNAFELSKLTMRIIKQNLYWALGYNCILIPIAAGLLLPLNISFSPMYSSIAMSLSSITVVSNALRINLFKPFIININENVTTYILDIDHMMCQHCQRAVENALLDIGIISTTELKHSTCAIKTTKKLDFELIKTKIKSAGYTVTNIFEKNENN